MDSTGQTFTTVRLIGTLTNPLYQLFEKHWMTMMVVSASEGDLFPTSALHMTLSLTVSIQPPQGTKWKSVVMTNNPNGFQREIEIKGQKLEEVENFKYLGAIISNEGSKPGILSRIDQTAAPPSRLKIIWRDKNISLASKVQLMRTLILSTFLYACESWIMTAESREGFQALEMR